MLFAVLLAPILLSPAAMPSPSGRGNAGPVAVAPASAAGVQPLAASLSFALVASSAQAQPKDTIVVTVYFNNTGTQASPAAWINVTAAGGFTFLGDNAAGNVTGYPDYRFSNVALGLHSFRMSFLVNVGTAPGTLLTVSATLVFSDGTGGQQFLGPSTASVLIGVVTKQLYLGWGASTPGILTPVVPSGTLSPLGTFTLPAGGPSTNFDLTPPLARSFLALNATAVLYLQPLTAPASLDVNLTLVDVNGAATNAVASVERTYTITGSGYWTLFYTFPSMSYLFPAGHQIRLQVLNTVASGQSALLATNASAMPSRVNLQTTTYVNVDAVTPALTPTTYLSPKSSVTVTANVSDPFGSAEVVAAHLNLTGPSGPLSGWADAFPVAARDPSTPSGWVLFRRTFSPPLANGTYAIEVTGVERNGVTTIADGGFVIRAPDFTLQKVASPTQGKSGTKITYFLWYNNTGTGPAARVWLNDTLPSQVNYQNSSTAPTTVSGSTYSWSFTNVAVGSHVLQIFVQVRGGVSTISYIRNWASVNYTDPQGFLWPAVRSHADVVINGPFLTLSQTSIPSGQVHVSQPVLFTIHVTNTGDAATALWINDTVPAGLTYVSDTATTVGGTRTIVGNQIHWTFPGMASGASVPTYLNFTMSATAAAGLSWGSTLRNLIGLNDTSTNGLLMPDQVSSLVLTVASPSIASAAASFGVPTAVPKVPLPLTINFTNAGNEAAGTTWINLTLNTSLQFVSASFPATFSSPVLQITMPGAALGADNVSVVLTADTTVADSDVLVVSGTLQSVDGYGNLLAPVPVAPGRVLVALPKVSFSLSQPPTSAEAGAAIPYTINAANTGHGTASAVWLNLSLPSDLRYVNDTFGATRDGTNLSWEWTGYAPGTRTYTLVLAASPLAVDRSNASFTIAVQAFDAGGNPGPLTTLGARVSFLAPAFRLSVWGAPNSTRAGDVVTFTLAATNEGSTAAQTLWLTDTLDSRLSLVSYDAAVPATGTTTLNWTFQDVAPQQTVLVTLVVRVADGTPGSTTFTNTVHAQFTNSAGVVLDFVSATSEPIQIPADWTGVLWILGIGSVLGGLATFVVYRRYRVQIEDVFLIYHDGILVSHLAQGAGLEKDEDQLSGMLTAVQDFVKDAFTYGEHRELHQLEFGDYHVLIERGKVVYLAVVYQGRDSGLVRKKVRTVLDRVESTYGGVFDRWDGDMAQVNGTRELLREGFVEDKHPWSLVRSRSS